MYAKKYVYSTSSIFRTNLADLPESLFAQILEWYHDNLNHPAVVRIYEKINTYFYYKGLYCLVETVHIDLFGPWNFTYVHSKFYSIKAVSNMDSARCCLELHEYGSKCSEDIYYFFTVNDCAVILALTLLSMIMELRSYLNLINSCSIMASRSVLLLSRTHSPMILFNMFT